MFARLWNDTQSILYRGFQVPICISEMLGPVKYNIIQTHVQPIVYLLHVGLEC